MQKYFKLINNKVTFVTIDNWLIVLK